MKEREEIETRQCLYIGASAQVAFQTFCTTKDGCMRNAAKTNLIANENVELFDIHYDVYTYSNLCFGNDEGRRRYQLAVIVDQLDERFSNVIYDPCTHPGQVERTISKKQILVDVCTINDKSKTKLVHENYVFKARPDMAKCQELTKRLVNPTYVEDHFGGHYVSYKVKFFIQKFWVKILFQIPSFLFRQWKNHHL